MILIQRQRTAIEISWNRQEILDIYNKHNIKSLARYPSKARCLQQYYSKFDGLSLRDIEKLLRHMSSNENDLDTNCTYHDCVINNYTDTELKLKSTVNQYNILKQEYDQLQNKYMELHTKFDDIHAKYVNLSSV